MTSELSHANRDLPLAPGERLVWSSFRGSSKLRLSTRQVLGLGFVGCYGFFMLFGLIIWGGLILIASAAVLGLIVAGVWFLVRSRRRPAFYLSDRSLIRRRWLGRPESFALSKIQRCQRYTRQIRSRYGVEQVETDILILSFPDRADVLFGPVSDFEGIWDLIHNAVLARNIDLTALASLDGQPPPAERRGDLFFALCSFSGEAAYGPVFIGPTRLVRFTEPLPKLLEHMLLTVLAGPTAAPDMEPHMLQLVRHPDSGHSTVVDLGQAALAVEGNTLCVQMEGRTHRIDLLPADAARAAQYLVTQRRAHPMR